MSKPVTHIAPHTRIQGELHLDGPAVIAGRLLGNLTAADAVEVTADGLVDGNIQGVVVTINGTVKGNVLAAQECRLGAKARVVGDICTGNLVISQGARFIGQVCVGDDISDSVTPQTQIAEEPAEEETAIHVVEATINRIEHAAERIQHAVAPIAQSVTMPAMPDVHVLTQNVQATLQRAPRIIKAR